MLTRCNNPKDRAFASYGGRGISVVPEWEDFETFFADMGHPSAEMSIERIDNNGPYCKNNCMWATSKQQSNNKRRSRKLDAFGKIQTMAQWAEETGIPFDKLRTRIDRRGWSVRRCIDEAGNCWKAVIRAAFSALYIF